jgi:hypothetical protein
MALTLIKDLGLRLEGNHRRRWILAECSFCKKQVEIRKQQLKDCKSCGCNTSLKAHVKHSQSRTRFYRIWSDMKRRCNNPHNSHYYLYGGRGITYNPTWEHFENFQKDMQEGYNDTLTLDRIDNNKGYSKENCRWVTKKQQCENRSKMYTHKEKDLSQWEQKRKIPLQAILLKAQEYSKVQKGKKKQFKENIAKEYNVSLNTVSAYLTQTLRSSLCRLA